MSATMQRGHSALAERGDRSSKCMTTDEWAATAKQVCDRLFEPRKNDSGEEREARKVLHERTLKSMLSGDATAAVQHEVQRIAAEKKALHEERFGPQVKQADIAAAMNRQAESQEKLTALLAQLIGGKK